MALLHGTFNDRMLDACLMKWPTLTQKEKLDLFTERACHELNFYIARKDAQFFTDHVVSYIANKIEWTFCDIYLLARFASDSQCHVEMDHIVKSTVAFDKLNVLEQMMAIEYAIF